MDYFQIFLDRALNPLCRAHTYLCYKHHNTIKYLIAVTPQGTVSFISSGWGRRDSGDVNLADRGFDIYRS